MLEYSPNSDMKAMVREEKEIVSGYTKFETTVKDSLETYINEFKEVSFDTEVFKTMLLNNFANAVVQVYNNLQNIESLSNILDILENQDEITSTDIETYNKLASKVSKDIELLQNFLCQTVASFENVPINGQKKSITIIN